LCFITLFVSEFAKYYLELNQLVYSSLEETLSLRKANELFSWFRKWQLYGYIIIPFFLFVKTHLIASLISIGTFFFGKEISYKILWRIVLNAEFIFILVVLVKVCWFYFFKEEYTLYEVQTFYPLSVSSVVNLENLEPWYLYPLQILNIFEVVYWIVLAVLLNNALKEKKNYLGLKILASSYGPALLIWVIAVMFVTLNMS